MATIVHYTAKDGKPSRATFPNRVIAMMFARNVRAAHLEETSTEVPDVKVKVLAPVALTRSEQWRLGMTEDKRSSGKKGGAP